ncbi:MAG TPA: hypothetical protein PLD14_02635 [Candidatus Pacearchaeota archaeon]|nr:hypothetical protein [Candidatus Pacearchaeota archaeon]HPR80098.1 hypothetical protein [Candidatus Pacearchaeota archaeon]
MNKKCLGWVLLLAIFVAISVFFLTFLIEEKTSEVVFSGRVIIDPFGTAINPKSYPYEVKIFTNSSDYEPSGNFTLSKPRNDGWDNISYSKDIRGSMNNSLIISPSTYGYWVVILTEGNSQIRQWPNGDLWLTGKPGSKFVFEYLSWSKNQKKYIPTHRFIKLWVVE